MAPEINSKEEQIRHTDVAFDASDLKHKPVFAFFIVLAGGVLLVHVFLWGIFQYMGKSQFAGHATTNPIMTSKEQLQEIGGDPPLTFPKPTLQPNPVADLNKFRAAEEEQMNTYGWVDPAAHRIHIPIERAIDAMSANWPSQENGTHNEATGVEMTQSPASNVRPATPREGKHAR